MRANKLCAILGNELEYNELLPLTEKRPLSLLPFDCKYRIIDFNLSSAINANVNSVFMVFNEGKTNSVFDHIGGGREWHLDSIQSRYFVHFYQDFLKQKAEGKPYYGTVIDYLKKSKSEYTVFMGNKMLCNVDLRAVLKIHQKHNNDMTVVYKRVTEDEIYQNDMLLDILENGNIRNNKKFKEYDDKREMYNLSMNIFIVGTEWLIDQLENAQKEGAPVSLQEFLNMKITDVKSSTYEYTGYLSNIFNIQSYYKANMDMLDPKKFGALLYSNKKVYTKLKNEVPTYYAETSEVNRSQFATGCLIYGKVEDSLIARSSVIEEGAVVDSSVILPSATIKTGAVVKYAVLDKNVVVEEGVKVIGTETNPVVIKKGSHVISDVYGGEQ